MITTVSIPIIYSWLNYNKISKFSWKMKCTHDKYYTIISDNIKTSWISQFFKIILCCGEYQHFIIYKCSIYSYYRSTVFTPTSVISVLMANHPTINISVNHVIQIYFLRAATVLSLRKNSDLFSCILRLTVIFDDEISKSVKKWTDEFQNFNLENLVT